MTSKPHSPEPGDLLVRRAFDDWKQFATGGPLAPVLRDLHHLRTRDPEARHSEKHYRKHLGDLSHQLSEQALLPNMEILGVRGGQVLARDKTRSQYLLIGDQVNDAYRHSSGQWRVKPVSASPRTLGPLDLSPGHIRPSDVRQGDAINDCRLQARLASLVQADPLAVSRMIHDNHNGTYRVTFAGAPLRPQTVAAPTPWERATFSTGGSEWTLILSKAYRQLERIPFGPPRAANGVEGLLTGRSQNLLAVVDIPCTSKAADAHVRAAQCATRAMPPMYLRGNVATWVDQHSHKASGIETRDVSRTLGESLANHMIVTTVFDKGKVDAIKAGVSAYSPDGHGGAMRVNLQARHAYSVLSYDQNKRIVVLRNPWGKNYESKSHKLVGEGTVVMPFDQFARTIIALDVEKTARSK